MIAYKSSGALTSNEITGLAVGGTYLIVTRSAINEIQVVNKTSGATVQTITTVAPAPVVIVPRTVTGVSFTVAGGIHFTFSDGGTQ